MGKADKDPNRPKKAQSAYFLFMGDFRKHCKQTGDANVSDVVNFTKIASEKWKSMTPKDREPYDMRAASEKQRYEQQMSMYVPTPGYSAKGTRKKKNPDAPKRPKSAYLFFLDEFREANRERLNHKEIISQGAQCWGKLTDDQKKQYNTQHEEAKVNYNNELKKMTTQPTHTTHSTHTITAMGAPGPSMALPPAAAMPNQYHAYY